MFWWNDTVIYEIYVPAFNDSNGDHIGDLNGIIAKLDYIQDLGASTIWLSPIFQSPCKDNGYDISSYTELKEDYGTMEDFLHLIQAVKERSMHIILELPVGQVSTQHPWFLSGAYTKNSPYKDYFYWRSHGDFTISYDQIGVLPTTPEDTTNVYGQEAWTRLEDSDDYYYHFFSQDSADLNWHNEKVRDEIYAIIHYWANKGVDGFRIEALDLLGKDIDEGIMENGPSIHPYLRELHNFLPKDKDIFIMGESWSTNTFIYDMYCQPSRKEIHALSHYEHITSFWNRPYGKWSPKTPKAVELGKIFYKWQSYLSQNSETISFPLFWESHDLSRITSLINLSPTENSNKHNMTQDQILYKSSSMLANLLYFQNGLPIIYQGQELGLENQEVSYTEAMKDLDASAFLKQNQIREDSIMEALYFGYRNQAKYPINWSLANNNTLVNCIHFFYKKVFNLRQTYGNHINGHFHLVEDDKDDLIAYWRVNPSENTSALLVICNFENFNSFDNAYIQNLKNFLYDINIKNPKLKLLLSNSEDSMVKHFKESEKENLIIEELLQLKIKPYDSYLFEIH